jgi:hypothetical protein
MKTVFERHYSMKKHISFSQILVLMLIGVVFLVGCSIFDNSPSGLKGTLTLKLKTDMGAKTLQPGVSLDVGSYIVTGTGPGVASFSETITEITAEVTYTRTDLTPGGWTIIVKGMSTDTSPVEIVRATQAVTIVARQTEYLDMTCLPIEGTGTLTVDLSWPTSKVADPEVLLTITPDVCTNQSIDFTSGDLVSSASWSSDLLQNGYYTLSIRLRDTYGAGKTVWGRTETVLILEGQPTTGGWELTETDMALIQTGGIELAVSSDSKKPLTITLAGNTATLEMGSTMTVTASASETPTIWQWYLNGEAIGGNSDSAILGSGLTEGAYWADVVAMKGDVAGSTGCTFRIIQPSIPRVGLVCEWLFAGNANDTSGNGNNGLVNGATLTADRFGHSGNAYSFDGADDYIQTLDNAILTQTGPQSISVWLKTNDTSVNRIIYGVGSTAISRFFISASNGMLQFNYGMSEYIWQNISSVMLNDDSWHNIIFVSYGNNPNVKKLYVDTVIVHSFSEGINSESVSGHYMAGGEYGVQYYSGIIDDARHYDYALNEFEIQALYNEGGWIGN